MDKIFLHDMKINTLIGMYEWERQHKQQIIFDVEIGINGHFQQTDDIEDTVHYGMICDLLRRELMQKDFLLLESLANYSAKILFDFSKQIQYVRIRITKPGILSDVRAVGVEIERTRVA